MTAADVDEEMDETEESAAEESVEAPAEEQPAPTSAVRRAWPVALLALAVLIAAVGMFSWWRAAHDDDLALARSRDAVLRAATSHIEALNSLDYRHVDTGLAKWRAITTGTLHDQIDGVSADEQKLLADQEKISTGKVTDAAVFSLDEDTATVVAAVDVTVKDDLHPDQPATVKRNRFSADMVLLHGRWLVEKLQQVAVDIS